jgi:hypothetical protein
LDYLAVRNEYAKNARSSSQRRRDASYAIAPRSAEIAPIVAARASA